MALVNYSRRSFVQTLFIASQGMVAGRLLQADTPMAGTNGLNFVVVGDWGRKGETDQKDVAAQMAVAAKAMTAQFVISLGDNFYEDGVVSLEDEHWEKSFETVYADPVLQVPWKVILGNHDYRGNCQAQLDYGRTHPRWGMPARYYLESHVLPDATKADFFYLDTSPILSEYHHSSHELFQKNIVGEDVPAQLLWLDRALAASSAPWKIVFGHHPIYSVGLHGNEADLIEKVLPILQKHGVQAYFCGHDHDLQHLQADKVDLFVSGGGSQHRSNFYKPSALFAQATSGFATVSLKERTMEVQFIDAQGGALYQARVDRQAKV